MGGGDRERDDSDRDDSDPDGGGHTRVHAPPSVT
jgi:hypothetical protein